MLSDVQLIPFLRVQHAGVASEPEQVRDLARHADGVIIGSALIEVLERGEDPNAFLDSLLMRDEEVSA